MNSLLHRLRREKKAGRPLVVGISGIDASGKTTLTRALAADLALQGQATQVIHLDDFHLPRSVRRACTAAAPVCYYRHTFDWEQLGQLLELARCGDLHQELSVLDLETDQYTIRRRYDVDPETVVLVDGVFLFQPCMLPWYDMKIYLHISEAECLARVVKRDGHLFGDADTIRQRYLEKYLPGQALYLEEADPRNVADLMIDNTNPATPVLRWRTPQ